MPIYEYRCENCGARFEKLVRSATAAIEIVCPECGSADCKKALSMFGSRVSSGSSYQPSSSACAPSG